MNIVLSTVSIRTSQTTFVTVPQRRLYLRWIQEGNAQPMDYEAVREAVRCWHPYCGLVYFHLLLKGLNESGALSKDLNNGVPFA